VRNARRRWTVVYFTHSPAVQRSPDGSGPTLGTLEKGPRRPCMCAFAAQEAPYIGHGPFTGHGSFGMDLL